MGNAPGSRRRRRLLLTIAGGAAVGLAPAVHAAAARADPPNATFIAFIDTLLPADALTPAASALRVPHDILREAAQNANYLGMIESGCAWLDRAAGGSFAVSSTETRDATVAKMALLGWDAPPRYFYEVLRQRAIELYYAHPASWGGLAITRPPQPIGYPDHAK